MIGHIIFVLDHFTDDGRMMEWFDTVHCQQGGHPRAGIRGVKFEKPSEPEEGISTRMQAGGRPTQKVSFP